MARKFTSLPDTHEKVYDLDFTSMVDTVVELADPHTRILRTAGMQISSFMAHAAVRMAKTIKTPIQEGRTLVDALDKLDVIRRSKN